MGGTFALSVCKSQDFVIWRFINVSGNSPIAVGRAAGTSRKGSNT
jgi:hypothetical protein